MKYVILWTDDESPDTTRNPMLMPNDVKKDFLIKNLQNQTVDQLNYNFSCRHVPPSFLIHILNSFLFSIILFYK
jgi:hypothetical protein